MPTTPLYAGTREDKRLSVFGVRFVRKGVTSQINDGNQLNFDINDKMCVIG